jgi:hypothetical protein
MTPRSVFVVVLLLSSAVCALAAPSLAHAQQVRVGPRLQGGWVVLNSDDDASDEGIDGIVGLGVGAQLVLQLDDTYGFQAELGWARRGAESSLRLFEVAGATTSVDTEIRLDYLEVPVLFRIHYDVPGAAVVPKVLVGPYFAGYLTGTARAEAFGLSAETDLEPGDDVDPFDFGLVLGIGADVSLTDSIDLTFDLRGQAGFIGVEADDGDSSLFNLGVLVNVGAVYQLLP